MMYVFQRKGTQLLRVIYGSTLGEAAGKLSNLTDWKHLGNMKAEDVDIQFVQGSIQLPITYEERAPLRKLKGR